MGPQRHQVGDRGAVRRRPGDDGDPGRLRPPLRPHRERAAAACAGPRGRRRRGGARADPARGERARGGHRGRPPRLLPAVGRPGQTGARRPGRRRRGGPRPGGRLAGSGVPAGRAAGAPPGPRHRPVVPVRPAGVLPAPGAAAVRFPLPHRDLHTRGPARVRLLRVAVPARRAAGRARRPEGRTRPRRVARGGCLRRTRSGPHPGGHRLGGRTADDGVLAGPAPT